jgi:phosphopantothenoylcysteine synthetase/decarboxylase
VVDYGTDKSMETHGNSVVCPPGPSTDELLRELDEIVEATGKAVKDILTASELFITGNLGETIPEPGHISTPTNQVKGRVGLDVATEVARGALVEATRVAQVATEDKTATEDMATLLTNATDVKAETLAEAGGEYSLEAEDRMGEQHRT